MSVPFALLVPFVVASSLDTQWAAAIPSGARVVVPAGTYAGPWSLAPGVHLMAEAGAILKGSASADAALTLTGDALIEGLRIETAGASYGVRVRSGKVELRQVDVWSNAKAKAGVFVAHAQLKITGGQIGGEMDYGLMAQTADRLIVSNATIHATRAAISVVSSPAAIQKCRLVGPFREAAIAVIHSPETLLTRNTLSAVKTMGIKITNSIAHLDHNRVTGGRADAQGLEGESLFVEGSRVTLSGDRLGDPDEAARGPVLSLYHSTAILTGARIEGGVQALIYVEDSTLTARDSELRNASVGLSVEEGSTASDIGFRLVNVDRGVVRLKQ